MSDTKTGTDTKTDTRTGTKASVRAGRRTVSISRPEKVLFPDDGITKSDLVGH